MPNNRKITLKKIKGTEDAHPYSRKAIQMKRCILRADKLENSLKRSQIAARHSQAVEKVLWFKEKIGLDQNFLNESQMHELMNIFISKNDEEIDQARSTLRPGRPKPPRLDLLESIKKRDEYDYHHSGIEIPDLMCPKNVKIIREFNGDFNGITRIKMMMFKAKNDKVGDLMKE